MTATSTTSVPEATATAATPPYDYQAKLDCISNEIETKLKKQFNDLFAQLENKLDNFIKRCSKQKADQDLFNKKVTKQLNYLVDNMKHFMMLANPTVSASLPLLGSGDRKA